MFQTPPYCVDGVEATAPRTCQPEAGSSPTLTENCAACGGERQRAWRSDVERSLGLILKRVASVEEAIGSVGEGITNIMRELDGMGRMFRLNVGAKPPGEAVHMQAPHTNAATSHPSEWQQGQSQSNACDMAGGVTTPTCHEREAPATQGDPPGTEARRPILVDLDNSSNDSRDNDETTALRNRIHETLGNRVHNQPRQRVVPCAKKLLCAAATSPIGETNAPDPPTLHPRATRYKDPPGYSDLRDFGTSVEPASRPPLLQPKTHGVSRHTPPMPCSKICP